MEDLSYKMICREMGSKQTKDGEMLQMKIPFWRFILYGRILKAQDNLHEGHNLALYSQADSNTESFLLA